MFRKLMLVVFAVLMMASTANAIGDFDVLWYTGGIDVPNVAEKSSFDAAAFSAFGFGGFASGGITFWDAGAVPAGPADGYDLLVVSSWVGPWNGGAVIDYASLDAALTGGALTFGERRVVTGQDVDFHLHNFPGSAAFDGPKGMFNNAAAWAAQGSGLGVLFINSGYDVGLAGDPGSYLAGLGTRAHNHGESVNIVDPLINSGLTDVGLSGWGTSHHDVWTGFDTNIWKAVTTTTDVWDASFGGAVTLVSAVPEPGTLALLGLGLAGAGLRFRRKK